MLDHREPARPRHIVRTARALMREDRQWLERQGVNGADMRRALNFSRGTTRRGLSAPHSALGPTACRRGSAGGLSLEGRATFTPVDVPPSPLLGPHENVHVDDGLGLGFRAQGLPAAANRARAAFRPERRPDDDRLGHPAVGHRLGWPFRDLPACPAARVARPHVRDLRLRPVAPEPRPRRRAPRGDPEALLPVEAEVFVGLDDFHSADVAFATNWWTAYPSAICRECGRRCTSCRITSRSSSPPRWSGSGPRRRTGWATAALRTRPGWPALLRDTYGLKWPSSSAGRTPTRTRSPGPRAANRARRRLWARRDTSAGGRARVRRTVRRSSSGAADARVALYGSGLPLTVPFPPRTSASFLRQSSRLSIGARARARLLADEPLARHPGDDGERPPGRRAERCERELAARGVGRYRHSRRARSRIHRGFDREAPRRPRPGC